VVVLLVVVVVVVPSMVVVVKRVVVTLVVVVVVVVVKRVVVTVVVVVVVTQPAVLQASQQLACVATQRPEAAQRSGVVILHLGFVPARQQATVPGRPQVERLAQERTLRAHAEGRSPPITRCVITSRAHLA
jgi:hypothetical protein